MSVFSPIIPLSIAIGVNKFLAKQAKILVVLIGMAFLADLGMLILASKGINNLFIAHIFGLIELIMWMWFFQIILKYNKTTFHILAVLFSLLYVLNSIFIEPLETYNSSAQSIIAILTVLLSIIYFKNIYINEDEIFPERSPEFWFCIAIFFCHSGGLFSLLLSSDILTESPDRFYGSWIIHNALNVLKNIVFAVGLWQYRRKY